MQSKATTVAQYLDELPADRRAAVDAVRRTVLANIDADVEEGMQYGMIGYYIPHRIFPRGYHCDPKQPVPFVALASQKNHLSLYLTCVYGDNEMEKALRKGFEQAGKKLDMGKSCVRFRKLEDISLDAIGDVIRRASVAKYLERYVETVPANAWKSAANGAQKTTPAKSRRADGGPASKA